MGRKQEKVDLSWEITSRIKEISKTIMSVVWGYTHGPMGLSMRDIGRITKCQVVGRCHGHQV